MITLPIYQVAAFTGRRFGGNPAAVVPLDAWLDEPLMQNIAAENNLSETAFFVRSGDNEWQIRWFTPSVEVPLCGHATLASAAVIRDRLDHTDWPITLHSASGPLSVDTADGDFILDFPVNAPSAIEAPDKLAQALGVTPGECYEGNDMLMAVLDNEQSVSALSPDFVTLARMPWHGVIATGPGDDVDFVSRFFAPAIGIDEDPVTGAAHCMLTPYWSKRLDKRVLVARQISTRVGDLVCELRDDRVLIRGQAVFYLDGEISV